MQIKKAIITAAGRGSRLFPMADTVQKAMLPIIDRDGIQKNIIQIIAEDAINSGIEDICIVAAPGDDIKYINNFKNLRKNLETSFKGYEWAENEAKKITDLLGRLSFSIQKEAHGYGHAILTAREFTGGDSFLLLLGDYLYVSDIAEGCAKQVISAAVNNHCSVSAVNIVSEHQIHNYGTITGKHYSNIPGLYSIEKLIEKPSISQAELELQTPGLRVGHYLCFFGMHTFTPQVMDILEEEQEKTDYSKSQLLLTPALQRLANSEQYLALEVKGRRYDLSRRYGLFEAQLALTMAGNEREVILNKLVRLMADASKN